MNCFLTFPGKWGIWLIPQFSLLNFVYADMSNFFFSIIIYVYVSSIRSWAKFLPVKVLVPVQIIQAETKGARKSWYFPYFFFALLAEGAVAEVLIWPEAFSPHWRIPSYVLQPTWLFIGCPFFYSACQDEGIMKCTFYSMKISWEAMLVKL